MPNQLYRIKEKYTKVKVNEHYTIMSSESDSVVLQSTLAIQLLDTISNTAIDKQTLVANYQAYNANLSDVLLTLHHLETEGYITHSPSYFSKEQSAYWDELGYNTEKLAAIFQSKTIAIHIIGSMDDTVFTKLCRDTGLQNAAIPTLTIVLTSDYLHPALESFNQQAITDNRPWILIKLQGTTPYIGPLMVPNHKESSCWKCMQHRLQLHDQENKLYQTLAKTNSRISRPLIRHAATEHWGASIALLELVSWLYYGHNEQLHNQLIALDSKTGTRSTHTLVKRPQCTACGDKTLLQQHPEPIVLQQQATAPHHQGGYRTVTPEETLERYHHHVSDITGIVPYLKAYHPMKNVPIHNYGSGKNLALQSSSLFWLNLHLRSANGGKGRTAIQAKTGALCEAIERYSLMYQGKTHTVTAAFHELEKARHPNDCMLYSKKQYQDRTAINSQSTKFYALIPVVFDEHKPMDWTPAYNLTTCEFNYLPSCYCYAQYPAEDETKRYAYPDSNGCAAGNTLEEAILQGFLELIERDAAAIWWYNRIAYPAVDLQTANNPYIEEMIIHYNNLNRSLYVLDITTDLTIPVFVAISYDLDSQGQIVYAFGAHLDANIALERAIIELNQLLPVVVNEENSYLTKDAVFLEWLETATLANNTYLAPRAGTLKDMQAEYPKLCPATLVDSIEYCMHSTQQQGLETLVVNLTQADVGLPVAKVIVPGLRHFWRRTAPGRLYEVPVKMGLLQKELQESELNPTSIFI